MQSDFLELLDNLGLDREFKLYVELFKQTPPEKFAVIKISGETLEKKAKTLAQSLALLSKIGLTPIVIHGGGSQIDKALKIKGIKDEKIDNLRVTTNDSISIIESELNKTTRELVNLINNFGGKSVNLNSSKPIIAEIKSEALGLVGTPLRVKADEITRACREGYIPVISCIGHNDKTALNVNGDEAAKALVLAFEPKKFILINEKGGVLDANDRIIPFIDLENDLPELIKTNTVKGGMLLKLTEIKDLLSTKRSTVVEICSSEKLLKELFTIKGSGTFIRSGAKFIYKNSLNEEEKQKARNLIENSFSKTLIENYFDEEFTEFIFERKFNSIAIVKKLNGVFYLDKFAVAKKSQGNGLGESLWKITTTKYPQLIWRSTPSNKINNWYFKQCDGAQKKGNWIVFWKGINEHQASELIEKVTQIPKTLI